MSVRWFGALLVAVGTSLLVAGCPDVEEDDDSTSSNPEPSPSPITATWVPTPSPLPTTPTPFPPTPRPPTPSPVPATTPTPLSTPEPCVLTWSPASVTFETVQPGEVRTAQATLEAVAGSDCVVEVLGLFGVDSGEFAFSTESELPFVLEPGLPGVTVEVSFQPDTPGDFESSLEARGTWGAVPLSLLGQCAWADQDGDGIPDRDDNCPDDANAGQEDADGDGKGDECDPCPWDSANDGDEDGVCGDVDNCPDDANAGQEDADGDGKGDECDPCPWDSANDGDGDGVCGDVDNCPDVANAGQSDVDGDGVGDACDVETCDGVDNDGDGAVDEDFPDLDGRGGADCHDWDGDGLTEDEGDCDDENAGTYPGAEEHWYDGVDSDCDQEENPDPCEVLPTVFETASIPGCGVDLQLRLVALCEVDCEQSIQVVYEVLNLGEEASPDGVMVGVYGMESDGRYGLIGTQSLASIPGGHSSGGMVVDLGSFDGIYVYPAIALSADDEQAGGGVVTECDERNNRDEWYLGDLDCPAPDPCDVPPPAFPVPMDPGCDYAPPVGFFYPVVKWQKSSFSEASAYNQIMMAPMVGNLTDDNGDGRVDDQDVPDIVFTTFAGGAYSSSGYLRVISGADGEEIWSQPNVAGTGGVALADADADGYPEVYVPNTGGYLLSFSHDGTYRWSCPTAGNKYAFPAVADVDGDGDGEILLGRSLCDHEGNVLVTTDLSHDTRVPFLLDMDLDGSMEIVSGAGVSRLDGSTVWTGPGGYGAAANFDDDELPEVVAVAGGKVRLIDDDGTLLWETAIPNGGGGPPTVADFDGDGSPEIGVAGADYYVVFETGGSVRWFNKVHDYSSQVTGSSVYDFDGDGVAEVVYADEYSLWVYAGPTGEVLLEESDHASGTLWEYPIIADVDRDGHAEIVLASNNYAFSGWTGITVLGDQYNSWVTARPVWNQHAYHITNIEDDLSLPQQEVPNWIDGNNTFRQGGFAVTGALAAPDLVPELLTTCQDACPDTARVLFHIRNDGLNQVPPGVDYIVWAESVLGERTAVVTGEVLDAIPPGWASSAIEVVVDLTALSDYARLILAVDDDGTGFGEHNECREDNNELVLPPLCP